MKLPRTSFALWFCLWPGDSRSTSRGGVKSKTFHCHQLVLDSSRGVFGLSHVSCSAQSVLHAAAQAEHTQSVTAGRSSTCSR